MSPKEQAEPSEVNKRILARRKVQAEMEDLRKQIRELRKKEENGQSVAQDIEACLGYLKVLKKEKDSIKEGNHETFLSAKKYISPKFNYGSKKEDLLAEIRQLAKEIRSKEKELAGGGYDADQRESLHNSLTEIKEKHRQAMLELKALEQFNHTRFLEQKEIEAIKLKEEEHNQGQKIEPIVPDNLPMKKERKDSPSDFNPPPMI